MATSFKLPKVAQYVKNVGKSITFAAIDSVASNTEGIRDFIDTNNDIFKDVYSSVRNYRTTMKNAERGIKQSNVYQAVEVGVKNLIADAKSGNFWNDRTGEYGEAALGLDDEGWDFGDDDSGDSSSGVAANKAMADSVSSAIGAAAVSQNTIVAQGTSAIIGSQKASTKMMMAHMDRQTAMISSSLGSVYSGIAQTNAFLHGPMMSHLENSRRFYEESLKIHSESNAMLKELLEMQRNLYKSQQEKDKESRLDNSMRADGSADIRGYLKNIKGNFGEIMDEFGLSSMKMDLGGGNPYLLYAAAPFKMILGPVLNGMLSKEFKKTLKSFDKGITSMFSQVVARMNTAREEGDGLMGIIGSLFGIKLNTKDRIDTSKYKKDAVPFDGITRQSIIETIPGYLSRIEAALTGGGERHYDFQSGTWKSAKSISKSFDDDRRRAISGANYEAMSELSSKYITPLKGKGKAGAKEAARLEATFEAFFTQLFNEGGDFKSRKNKPWEHYGMSEKDFKLIMSLGPDVIRGFAGNSMQAREGLSKTRANQERNGGVQRHLFNGAYDETGAGDTRRKDPSKFGGGGIGILAQSLDKHGRNIFWYLEEILNYHREKAGGKVSRKEKRARARSARSHASTASSTSTSSSESGDPDPDPDGSNTESAWAAFEEEKAEREKKEAAANKKKSLGDWAYDKFGKTKAGGAFAKVLSGAEMVLTKPMDFMTKLLKKADESMFKLMFGEKELKDAKGKQIKSVFNAIIQKVEESFNKLMTKLSNAYDKYMKPLVEKYFKPVKDNLKGMAKAGFGRVKQAFSNTFGRSITSVRRKFDKTGASKFASDMESDFDIGRPESDQIFRDVRGGKKSAREIYKDLDHKKRLAARLARGEVVGADQFEGKNDSNPGTTIVESAYGRYVTKRGLTMISPGEIIIPASFDKKEQAKMLSKEKRDRSRIGRVIGLNAAGSFNTDAYREQLKQIYNENQGQAGKNIASGIMGAGAGLLTGINPLLGAMAGAGISILSNSKTFQNVVFGKEMENGEREGGLIPKKIQDIFKKYGGDMMDFGIAGGVLGLLTPFGPLGGAAIGAGVGLLKNSDGFKKFIFGDAETGEDGLISKESMEKATKFLKGAAPKMAIGAIAGAMAGPFGLLGNVALGAGAGMLAHTDTFGKFLFGDKETGRNGLFGAINNGILQPAKEKIVGFLNNFKEYAKKHILDPMKNFWKPFTQMIKNAITNVGNGVRDFLKDMFERTMGTPIADFLQEKVFKPSVKVISGILKAPVAVGKAVLAAPFKVLGGIGNNIRAKQIKKGTAYDMSASERLAWRDEHKVRTGVGDKMKEQDELLANMSEEDLASMAANARGGLESMDKLQKNKGAARERLGNLVSGFMNEKVDGKTRYGRANYKEVQKALKKIQESGDLKVAEKEINAIKGLTKEEKKSLLDRISEQVLQVHDASAAYDAAQKGAGAIDKELEGLVGHKVKGRKGRRQIAMAAEAELKARRKAAKAGVEDSPSETPEEATDLLRKVYTEKTDIIIALLKKLNGEKVSNEEAGIETPDGSAKAEEEKEEEAVKRALPEAKAQAAVSGAVQQVAATPDKANAEMTPSKVVNAVKPQGLLGKAKSAIGGLLPFGKKVDEDSKEATDARNEEEAQEAHDKASNDAEIESKGLLQRLVDGFGFGKKKDKEKKGGGILGKIGSGISNIFSFLGGGLKSLAGSKIGLVALGAAGIPLIGHLSHWFKENVLPGLKGLLFGKDTDGDGKADELGLFGKLKNRMENSDSPIAKAFNWVSDQVTKIGKKGFWGYFAEDVMPTLVSKFATGWGYAMQNIVAPLTALLIKNLPSMLVSLGKALITGIGAAILNKKIGDGSTVSVDSNTTNIANQLTANNNQLGSYVDNNTKKAFAGYGSGIGASGAAASGSATINMNKLIDPNWAEADETFDKDGNALNKTSEEIMYEKAPGILGWLGAKQSTNQVYYNKDGSIGVQAFDQYNTTDSIASKGAKVAGRSFLKGLGGKSAGLFGTMAKTSLKSKGGLITKGVKTGVKGTIKATGAVGSAANNAGFGLRQKILKMGAVDEMATTIANASGGKLKYDDVLDLINTKGVTNAATELIDAVDDDLGDVILNAAIKADDQFADVVSEAAKRTAKETAESAGKKGILATAKSKVSGGIKSVTSKAGNFVKDKAGDLLTKGKNTKLGTKILGAVDNVKGSKVVSAGKKVVSGVKTATTAVKNVATKAKGATVDAVKSVGKKAASGAKGMIEKIAAKITTFFDDILASPKIMKFLGKACKEGGESALPKAIKGIASKLTKAVSKVGAKALTKIAAGVAKVIPYVNIALYVIDFLHGYNNADTILGVAKGDTYKVNIGQKCLCGLLNLVTSNLTFGLVPNETVVDLIVDVLFPIFGLDATELKAARARADDIMAKWNEEHPDETYTNLEDFNNKDKLWFKMKKGAKKLGSKAWEGMKKVGGAIKDGAVKAWDKTKELGGKAVNALKTAGSAVAGKVKEVAAGALDIGTFVKDVVKNVMKYSVDPDYKWSIDDYIKEDDPLGGVKKVIYTVLKIPLGIIGTVTRIGKMIFDKIKGFVVDVKDGIKDAWGDISNVAKGKYTVFSKEYWKFNKGQDDKENPMGAISKVASTILKVLSMPHAMVGWVGSKIFDVFKKLVSGAKEGIKDAWGDISNVAKGQYTVFSKEYWKFNNDNPDNPMSTLGKVASTIIKIVSMPHAMVGWVGSKVVKVFKDMVAGAKEGISDAWVDISNVAKGQYTIFSKEYWKFNDADDDNPMSTLGKVASTIIKIISAPKAMLGWVGSKIVQGFKAMINGAKEGTMDAKADVDAVKKGQYTIFSKQYWKSDNEDPENPISTLGNIFGIVSRVVQAPSAMLGWTVSKVVQGFKAMINGAKEGTLDAKADVDAVKAGQYTIFSKQYWKSDAADDGNPLTKLGSIFGIVSRVVQAPSAMLGWTVSKVKQGIMTMINGVKDVTATTNNIISAAENGEYSVFSKSYWQSIPDEGNPLGIIGNIASYIQRLFMAPIVLIKGIFGKIKNAVTGAVDKVKDGAKAVSDWAGEKVEGVKNKVKEVGEKIANSKVGKAVSKGVDAIKSGAKKVGNFFKGMFGGSSDDEEMYGGAGFFSNLKNKFKQTSIGSKISGVVDNAKSKVSSWYDRFKQTKLGGFIDKGVQKAKDVVTNAASVASHIYQKSPLVSAMKFGKSTIGKIGCAPVAATNLINSIFPGATNIAEAAKFAEKNGMVNGDTGTNINFFKSFLNSKGIGANMTANSNSILDAIKNGMQVVLLGKDGNNNKQSAFGKNNHFITAKGIDKNGNIVVQDPDSPNNTTVYSPKTLLKSMKMGIVTDQTQSLTGAGRSVNYAREAYNQFGSGRVGSGAATASLAQRRAYAQNYYGGAGTGGQDYAALLDTIVSILMTIAGNTAVLDKILKVLSENLGIKVEASEIQAATQANNANTAAKVKDLVSSNNDVAKRLNSRDTDYMLKVMSKLASE